MTNAADHTRAVLELLDEMRGWRREEEVRVENERHHPAAAAIVAAFRIRALSDPWREDRELGKISATRVCDQSGRPCPMMEPLAEQVARLLRLDGFDAFFGFRLGSGEYEVYVNDPMLKNRDERRGRSG